MSKRTYAILAAVVGSAVSSWWFSRQNARALARHERSHDRGTVIFHNTPTAAE